MVLHSILCHLNFRFCQEKYFCTFLSAKKCTLLVGTLRTKSEYRTKTCTVKHHMNIEADKNFRATMLESKRTYKIGQKSIPNRAKRHKFLFGLHPGFYAFYPVWYVFCCLAFRYENFYSLGNLQYMVFIDTLFYKQPVLAAKIFCTFCPQKRSRFWYLYYGQSPIFGKQQHML